MLYNKLCDTCLLYSIYDFERALAQISMYTHTHIFIYINYVITNLYRYILFLSDQTPVSIYNW